MKNTFLLLIAVGITTVSFAQKDEIKAATKALKSNDAPAVLSALEGAAAIIDTAEDKYVVSIIFYKEKLMVYKLKQVILPLMTKLLLLIRKW